MTSLQTFGERIHIRGNVQTVESCEGIHFEIVAITHARIPSCVFGALVHYAVDRGTSYAVVAVSDNDRHEAAASPYHGLLLLSF
jgi:hypothetical protein